MYDKLISQSQRYQKIFFFYWILLSIYFIGGPLLFCFHCVVTHIYIFPFDVLYTPDLIKVFMFHVDFNFIFWFLLLSFSFFKENNDTYDKNTEQVEWLIQCVHILLKEKERQRERECVLRCERVRKEKRGEIGGYEGVRGRWTVNDIEILIFKMWDKKWHTDIYILLVFLLFVCYPHTKPRKKGIIFVQLNWLLFHLFVLACLLVFTLLFVFIFWSFFYLAENCWPLTKQTCD